MRPLSYSSFMTLNEGSYQFISHENNSFGVYIDKAKKINLLFISDEPMFNIEKPKKITIVNEDNRGYLSISDIDVSVNDIFIRHNLASLADILEEKDVVNSIHTIDISKNNYEVLDSITSENEIIDLYFYNITDKDLFEESFMSELALIVSETGEPISNGLDKVFELSDLNYFDVYPMFKQFNESPENMNIIDGAELIKLKVKVVK